MAQIKNGILGDPSGRLGKLVFRKMNGKIFVSSRPKKYYPTKSKSAKNVRNGFKQINLFVSTINKNETLKQIWKSAKIAATNPYTKNLKTNLAISPTTGITLSNVIVPNNKLQIDTQISVEVNQIKISYKKNSLAKYFPLENKLQCFIQVFSSEPIRQGMPEFSASLYYLYDFSKNDTTIEFIFENRRNNLYKKELIFNSLLILENEKVINWSSTIANEFIFE